MDQICLQKPQKLEAAFVSKARELLNDLVQYESRGPGDTENAIRRLAEGMRVGFNPLWSLKYRPPKSISAGILYSLQLTHEAMCERQAKSLEEKRSSKVRQGWLSQAVAGVGDLVAGE